MIVQRTPGVFSKKVGSVWLLLEPNKKYIRHLNQAAGYIWSLAKDPKSIDTIALQVSKKFGISQKEARADVQDFVSQYVQAGFLREIKP